MKCLNCWHVSDDPARRFCGGCGERLSSTQSPFSETTPPGSYTPTHLALKILRTRSALEGERKQVTVLFCDIANSTSLSERIGPDRMHQVLTAFFEAALVQVHRYEGTVNQFLGDGFMALFGAPLSHEDHSRRAVLAALEVQKSIASHALFQSRDIALKTRIGLHTGPVVVGGIGDNLRMDYTAIGDTTNVAARIQGLAEPGTILASDNLVRIAEHYVESRPIGMHTLKGKAGPILLHYRTQGSRVRVASRQQRCAGGSFPGRRNCSGC